MACLDGNRVRPDRSWAITGRTGALRLTSPSGADQSGGAGAHPPGEPKVKRSREGRYELLSCALAGHHLVGVDAATVSPDDAMVVRELGGLRWYRCLRCDGWFPAAPPEAPTRDRVPGRDEIEVPMRGPQLRDRYVLRLIAIDRGIHVVLLTLLVLAVVVFVHDRKTLENDYQRIMTALTGQRPDTVTGWLAKLHHLFLIRPGHLYEIAVVALAYAALESCEMVGLWLAKRWAEYLTFVATILLIPIECYELASRVTALKIVVLVINVAIAAYLLFAKRLFGLRGGEEELRRIRREGGGWAAVERATAMPPEVAAATMAGGDPVPGGSA